MADERLYERLGGVFAIAAVIDHFSDAVVQKPDRREDVAEPSPQGVAHDAVGQVAGPQVHAHPLGVRGRGRPVPIHGHKAGNDRGGT
jgi:hypothetical protein